MNISRIIFALFALFIVLLVSANDSFRIEELTAIGLFVYFLLNFIDSIGKSYNPLDVLILIALFQCMVMPTVVYHVYNDDIGIKALKYDMTVSADRYYGFIFPAVIALIIGIKLPGVAQRSYQQRIYQTIQRAKQHLQGKGNVGFLFIIIGFVSGIMTFFVPGDLNYVVYLFEKLLYVGVLYIYFSDFKSKKLYLGLAFFFIFSKSLVAGMFGELVYIVMLGSLLVLLGQKIKNYLKFGIALAGMVFIFLIQSVKSEYRAAAWSGTGGGASLYLELVQDRLSDPGKFFDWTTLFPFVNRANQGMIIGKVMDHVPARAPFANGETIFTSLAASFVPRLLWPNKPIAGGKVNMERFTGFVIDGYSMNISPLGEAYGNFDVEGGIVFMFFYGLFFALVITMLLQIGKKRPTILLWIPVLFLNSVQIETDILMCVNSMIKSLLFVWFCYWAGDRFLRLKL
ncbi:hypothetical protein IQ13_2409 [Lacibacter cauensis]|uniref:Oligosaccharide repeat unit polymerase n=1 Tax=Lacibacter cauensis TaxID=510947 RepID=A0A562SJF6_9BACT|nr:hypothetical protein [Lacibacter cauensis]TWI81391.1 hypothetical protein IQ13_2409 [Lacibacter cauensis]